MISGLTHTILIILITILTSIAAWQHRNIMNRLIFNVSAIKQGQYDRFLTHGFIHKDGIHLFFNMFTLYFFGRSVEGFFRNYLSGMGFVLFYCSAIIIAAIPSYLHNRSLNSYRSLGASGAVNAVLFSAILFDPWGMIYIYFIPVPAIIFGTIYLCYSMYAMRSGHSPLIDHRAHVAGAMYGFLFPIILAPSLGAAFFYKFINTPLF